jgi:hypothetical protein
MFWKIWHKSNFVQVVIEDIYIQIYVYARASSQNSNSSTLELDWLQCHCPGAHVIAQQYSSATFISLQFHSCQEKFGAFQNILFFIFYFLKIAWSEIM